MTLAQTAVIGVGSIWSTRIICAVMSSWFAMPIKLIPATITDSHVEGIVKFCVVKINISEDCLARNHAHGKRLLNIRELM